MLPRLEMPSGRAAAAPLTRALRFPAGNQLKPSNVTKSGNNHEYSFVVVQKVRAKTDEADAHATRTSTTVHISNVRPRLDQHGRVVNANMGSLLRHRGIFYLYGIHFPPCPLPPAPTRACPKNVYSCFDGNTIAVYSSPDLQAWTLASDDVLPAMKTGPDNNSHHAYFEPYVVCKCDSSLCVFSTSRPTSRCTDNNRTEMFVMVYDNTSAGGMMPTATSSSPTGPFTPVPWGGSKLPGAGCKTSMRSRFDRACRLSEKRQHFQGTRRSASLSIRTPARRTRRAIRRIPSRSSS